MTSRKDSAVESDLASRFDVGLEEQMSGLKLKILSRNEAENSKSSPRSTEDASIEKAGSISIDKSESGSSDTLGVPNSLERTAQQLVIQTFKNLGSPPPPGEAPLLPLEAGIVTSTDGNEVPSPARSGGAEVHFEGIESKLLEYLARADGVKMCAAWFTSTKIAEQLSLMGDVGLIIGSTEKITPGHPEYRADWVHTLLTDLPDMVFVYGGASGKRMMHNKFMVLFREGRAYAVITGSYNYTYRAGENWENIVYIESDKLGQKYLAEYTKILQHCQPLSRYLRR